MAKDSRIFIAAIIGLAITAILYGMFDSWLHQHILAAWILFTMFVAAYGIALLLLLAWLLKRLQQENT
jgi:phosphate/sulfate permease